MTTLETKIDLLAALALADDEASRKSLKQALREQMLKEPEPDPVDVDDAIEDILRQVGVPCSLLGYNDLVVGLHLILERPGIEEAITKEFYPEISKIRNRPASRIERAIRHAIEVAWDRCDVDVLYDMFGNTVSFEKTRPTNSEFITQMAHHIRRRVRR